VGGSGCDGLDFPALVKKQYKGEEGDRGEGARRGKREQPDRERCD
jgi:hypothetical protein